MPVTLGADDNQISAYIRHPSAFLYPFQKDGHRGTLEVTAADLAS